METTARLDQYIADQIAARPLEAKIIKRIYNALKAAGTPITKTWDGYDQERVTSLEEVYTVAFNLDEVWLQTAKDSWVRLTMGEEWDTLTDYTVDLEEALSGVNTWIMRNN